LTELQLSLTQASSGAVVIAPAETPHKPSSPKPITDAAVFAVLGLLIGVALALGLDYFDDRIRSREHLAAAIDPIPILGEVPKFKDSDDAEYGIITFEQPHSAAAEAYRGLRTSVQFLAQDSEGARVILISSPTENDGKTTTAVNLATTIAMGGRRVILIGSDLRRPQLHNYFGLPSERGFSRVLSGELEVDDALVWLDVLPDLGIIPGGIIPPNPAELLDSERSAAVFAHLRTLADFVLIDSPPVLPVTDAVVLMRHVDAAILIAYSEQTRERELGEAIDLLTAVGGSVSGVVLNGVTYESGRYRYQYGYGYRERGYGSRTPTKDGGSLAPVGPIMDTDGDASPSSSGVLNRMVDRLRGTSDEA